MDQAVWTPQYSPSLWSIDNHHPILPGVPLVPKRKYHRVSEEGARRRSILSGQYISTNSMFPMLTWTHKQLSGAANGLRYVHDQGWRFESLRPVREPSFLLMRSDGVQQSHILIDNRGTTQLDVQARGDFDNHRYSAPETQFPGDHSRHITPNENTTDIYGMGTIIYEVSFHCPGGPGQRKTSPYSRSWRGRCCTPGPMTPLRYRIYEPEKNLNDPLRGFLIRFGGSFGSVGAGTPGNAHRPPKFTTPSQSIPPFTQQQMIRRGNFGCG